MDQSTGAGETRVFPGTLGIGVQSPVVCQDRRMAGEAAWTSQPELGIQGSSQGLWAGDSGKEENPGGRKAGISSNTIEGILGIKGLTIRD